MDKIDFSKQSPLKMNELIRVKKDITLSGNNIPESLGGFWHIKERTDINNRGGRAKLVRVMTGNQIREPLGETFTMWYGMVCGCMEQVSINPI